MLDVKRDIHTVDGRPVGFLKLKGYLDSMDSMKLERAIDEIYAQDVFDVIMDVTQLSHISSPGWSVIVSRLSLLGKKRGFFRFVGMRPEVEQVFHMVGFQFIEGIELHPDSESAVQACRNTVTRS
jgi:anti-anti-sigma factor